ncbi:MAG: sulfotransferase [Chthoniobacterales bacterium]|nr:sulfotransferase [Chthoniobacterales bacterium]
MNAAKSYSGTAAGGPLFVVGMYRSGTTLLYALLNQHPEIALLYECDALAVPGPSASSARWPRWIERNELWNDVLTRHRIERGEIGSHDLRGLYQAFSGRSGAQFYGEKAPAYARWLPKMLRNFPQARLIVVLRELPEIYQSVLDAGRKGSRFFRRRGQLPRLLWSHRAMMRDLGRLKQTPVFLLRYREVVSDASEVGKRICDFLGLPFNDAMSSLVGADFSAIYAAPHHDWVRSERIVRRFADRAAVSFQLQRDLKMFGQASGQAAFVPEEELPALGFRQKVRYQSYLVAGCLLCILDDAKRLLYEFLPESWFRHYRRMRSGDDHLEISGKEDSSISW